MGVAAMLVAAQQLACRVDAPGVLDRQPRPVDRQFAAAAPQAGAEDLCGDAMCGEIAAQDLGFQWIGGGVYGVHDAL